MKRVVERIDKIGRLRFVNHCLTVVAVGLGLYIVFAPLLPQADWWVTQQSPLKQWMGNSDKLSAAEEVITDNRVLIPVLGLSQHIHEGGANELSKGVVRRSHTSYPGGGSNTVLVGHRFGYNNDGVFYHLDKLSVGDQIVVHWDSKNLEYTVKEKFVVPATKVDIENASETEILTLYTCTPLWNPVDRLVIRAVPVVDQGEAI